MSMIGLFTVAPQATGAKTPSTDAAAAEGFGCLLQGALDALAQDAAGAESDTPLLETETAAASTVSAGGVPQPLLGEPGAALPVTDDSPASGVPAGGGETAMGKPGAASVSSTSGVPQPPLAEPVGALAITDDSPASGVRAVESETPAGKPLSALTSSATGVAVATPTSPAETAVGKPVPVSTGSASGVAGASPTSPTSPTSPVELGVTLPGKGDVPASGVREGGSEVLVGKPAPASISPAGGVPQSQLVEPVESRTAKPAPGSTTSPSGASSSPAPLGAPVPVASAQPVAASASVAPSAPTLPLTTQLTRPIFSLAAAGTGEHVMTVSITPDNLGPVTVRAHVGPEGVRVELFAPNDPGRDAIRTIIPDLKRDLVGAGLGGNLTLSSQNQPSSDGSPHGAYSGQQGDRDTGRAAQLRASATDIEDAPESGPGQAPSFGTTSTIDVLA